MPEGRGISRKLMIKYVTGQYIKVMLPDGNRQYIDTFQMDGGALIFHVFEDLS